MYNVSCITRKLVLDQKILFTKLLWLEADLLVISQDSTLGQRRVCTVLDSIFF